MSRALALALLLVGCGEPAAPDAFPFRFVVASEGAPVAGARVRVASEDVGVTGDDGRVDVELHGQAGRAMPLEVDCPSEHRDPTDLRPVILQRLRALEGENAVRRVRVDVDCPPRTHVAVVLVRVPGHEGVPVLVDGTERTRTDADGLAHVPLDLEPRTSVEIALSTEHLPELLPRNPTRTFVAPDHDELWVFEQALAEPAAGRRRRRRRRSADAGPNVPIRIE